MKKNLFLAVLTVLMLASCSTTQDNTSLAYFQNLKDANGSLPSLSSDYKIKIQPDDELIISITSAVPEATAMYNVPLGNPSTRGNVTTSQSPRIQTHIVDNDGQIQLPVIGTLKVSGLSTEEISRLIKAKVAENVKDPYVRVELASFAVNVMGEVKSPQRLTVNKEKFTVLDALAAAGDLTEYGKRDNVLVIRTENGQSTYHRINLTDGSIYSSPYFYLQQNDVIYVEPNAIKVDNSKYNQYSAFKLSTVSTIVSMTSVIASLVIALCVK